MKMDPGAVCAIIFVTILTIVGLGFAIHRAYQNCRRRYQRV